MKLVQVDSCQLSAKYTKMRACVRWWFFLLLKMVETIQIESWINFYSHLSSQMVPYELAHCTKVFVRFSFPFVGIQISSVRQQCDAFQSFSTSAHILIGRQFGKLLCWEIFFLVKLLPSKWEAQRRINAIPSSVLLNFISKPIKYLLAMNNSIPRY